MSPRTNARSVLWSRTTFSWMGRHSGYDVLCDVLERTTDGWSFEGVHRAQTFGRFGGRWYSRFSRPYGWSSSYDLFSYELERRILARARRGRFDLIHLTYLEKDLGLIATRRERIRCPVIATSHLPVGWWRLLHRRPEITDTLDGVITLTTAETEFLSSLGRFPVWLVPHGVDTEFFSPATGVAPDDGEVRGLVVGHFLRDLDVLERVIRSTLAESPRLSWDILMPYHAREKFQMQLRPIARHARVRWHARLDDLELRDLYRRCDFLFLPLLDATANNAVLEAMACGLPIVSSRVGGLIDYTDETFATLCDPADSDAMCHAVITLAETAAARVERAAAARRRAEKRYSWPLVAPKVLDVYRQVIDQPVPRSPGDGGGSESVG